MDAPVVIVGGGTAGCTVAAHLAAHTTRRIIVCEPGAVSGRDDVPGFFDVIGDGSLVTTREVMLTRGRRTDAYLQARAVGGGSAVNAMLLTGSKPGHLRGLTRVATVDDMGEVSRALVACGGEPSRLWWNRGRWNPGRALVHLVEEGRVEIVQGSVSHIEFDGRRSVAVHCGDTRIATDMVVLAAGAIESPGLLFRSGCAGFVRGIGEGLQDHPCITFVLPLHRPGAARFDAAAVKRVDAGNGMQGLLVAYERAAAGQHSTALLSALLMTPASTGRVTSGGDVHLGLLDDEGDVRAMGALVREACAVLSSAPFAGVCGEAAGDEHGTTTAEISQMDDVRLAAWMRNSLAPVSHVSGSLGRCVDATGHVVGLEGVVAADASVLRGVPHETPAAPVTMEALRIARALGEELA